MFLQSGDPNTGYSTWVDSNGETTVTVSNNAPRFQGGVTPTGSGPMISHSETRHAMTPTISAPRTVSSTAYREEMQPTVTTTAYETVRSEGYPPRNVMGGFQQRQIQGPVYSSSPMGTQAALGGAMFTGGVYSPSYTTSSRQYVGYEGNTSRLSSTVPYYGQSPAGFSQPGMPMRFVSSPSTTRPLSGIPSATPVVRSMVAGGINGYAPSPVVTSKNTQAWSPSGMGTRI